MQEITPLLDQRLRQIEATQQRIFDILTKAEPTPPEKKYLTAEEAAKYLNMSVGSLYNHITNRTINFRRFSRKLYFTKEDLDQFVNGKTQNQKP